MKKCDQESLGRHIYITSQEMRNFAEKVLKPFDLTLEQFHLLKNMSTDSGMSQREIGEITRKSPANITRLLDRMESKMLVVRKNNPEDRRASLVFLTEKGLSLIEEVLEIFESFSSQLVHGITDKEHRIVRNVLTKMTANIQKMTEKFGVE